ncbi:MAG: serine/threonine-protein kinase [Eubacteriaceae bacterium]
MNKNKVLKKKYELLAEIGRGGNSTVFLARDIKIGRLWAVKAFDTNNEMVRDETMLLAGLYHADIPRIVEFIEEESVGYVIMDYIDGEPLEKKIEKEGYLNEEDVINIALSLCDILNYLHTVKEDPIIFCDLKPKNIIIVDNRAKLIDFGIAKICKIGKKTQDSLGTKGYAAPEQYSNGSHLLGPWTDIYSLGATLYKMSTGITLGQPTSKNLDCKDINPNISWQLNAIISRCLEIEPEKRYGSINILIKDLKTLREYKSGNLKKATKKITIFFVAFFFSLIFIPLTLFAFQNYGKFNEQLYTEHYNLGKEYEKNNKSFAREEYIKALKIKPEEKIFLNLYYLKKDDCKEMNTFDRSREIIDFFKSTFSIEELSNSSKLLVLLIEDIAYLQENEYFDFGKALIKEAKKGNNQSLTLEILELLLESNSKEKMNEKINEVKKIQNDLTMNEKVNTTYLLIAIMTIADENGNRSGEINEIGEETRMVIETSGGDENFTFNRIIELYEMIASYMFVNGSYEEELDAKKELLDCSRKWYSYVEKIGGIEDKDFLENRFNLNREYVAYYRKINDTSSVIYYLEKMKEDCMKILSTDDPNDVLILLKLAQTSLESENEKPLAERDYSICVDSFNKLSTLQNTMTKSQLDQYSSLRSLFQLQGVEV